MYKVEVGVNLAKYTTFGVGGCADYLVTATKTSDLVAVLDWALSQKLPYIVLGGGSNVLISDNGFRGLVVINRTKDFQITGNTVVAESGASFGKIARDTLDLGLVGLHFGAGIPGTIGGAISGNAGALGWEISKTLKSAQVWRNGRVELWKSTDLDFDYRYSKVKESRDVVVLSAEFEFEPGDKKELEKIIKEDKVRRAGSYLGRTCGSYFKNPSGKSAGELIDQLGLKGYSIGGAEVSPLHANVLRNKSGATASEILALETYLTNKVKEAYKVTLQTEVVKIGF